MDLTGVERTEDGETQSVTCGDALSKADKLSLVVQPDDGQRGERLDGYVTTATHCALVSFYLIKRRCFAPQRKKRSFRGR